ncbi:transporter substrate-binding domain-containing protein [Microbulbifer yueqingensis]|uniref:Membrane-bound lytic murein transglycosylase F n=1 Tax=Microbulbifer yueqingensis TaxID=658219 RepID=A0A1G9DNH2_9GAMM|nr:transporter substrate-binding domain-containing protein [Microbulbifer yueqingensis]SDK65394.1 membrane-bound lytic murein transglycosylase F [Microbulbifer yueqingensis]
MNTRLYPAVSILFLLLALVACGSGEDASEQAGGNPAAETTAATAAAAGEVPAEPMPPAFQNYSERGDLPALRERGVLRLLAPRGEAEDALPRDGLPGSAWRELAEKFARSRGLKPQWVYVESFAGLVPALVEGRGDVIAINFSRTQEREERVSFTRPLQYVRELLVTSAEEGKVAADEPMLVAVRRGSAFAATLEAQNALEEGPAGEGRFTIAYLDEPVDHDSLLDAVVAGDYQATVLDSNLADALLPDYPQLEASDSLGSQRAIAWAVRKENPALKRALNEFFTSEHLVASQMRERPLRDWAEIQSNRTLRVLTRNHPASYFMWQGELMGFDYDLLQQFARENNLRLSMVVPGPDVDLGEALRSGLGDVIAASLTVTDARHEQGLRFTRPYLEVTEQVIAARPLPDTDADQPIAEFLAGREVAVNPLTSFYSNLRALEETQEQPLQVVPVEGAATEHLIDAVVRGEYDFTVADSHLVDIESTYRDDFAVVGELPGKRDIAWAVRPDQPVLLKHLNSFLNKHYRGLFFNVTYNKYFRQAKRIRSHTAKRLRNTDELSPFDPLVRKYAGDSDRDWRMVVAQMYQESQFDPQARSFAGARGLMQVLPRTAAQMGISDLFVPENNIRAGVTYLDWLEERFPRDLDFDQKIYFTLAAYNAGHGHVRDARRLAESLGKDPDRWFGHVEEAMLKLSQPEYYRKARFGYVRGREPVNYVRQIRSRYLGYLAVARNESGQ